MCGPRATISLTLSPKNLYRARLLRAKVAVQLKGMDMNDAEIKRMVEGGPVANPNVVMLLEQALLEARQGRISGCALVKEHGGQMTAQMAGNLTAGIYFGCDLLKDTLKAQLTGGGGRGPAILRRM